MSLREQNLELADEILVTAHKFYSLRYQMSDGGNLSVLIPGTAFMLVKGTNMDFGSLDMEALVVADFDGRLVEGSIAPSKESRLHGAIYRAFPDVGAIMHCHSPWATAWAAHHEALEFSTHHARIKLGGHCPVIDTQSYAVKEEHFDRIISMMRQHARMKAFLLRGHGQVAWGNNMREAAMTAELIEETAQIARLSLLT